MTPEETAQLEALQAKQKSEDASVWSEVYNHYPQCPRCGWKCYVMGKPHVIVCCGDCGLALYKDGAVVPFTGKPWTYEMFRDAFLAALPEEEG